MGVGGSCEGEGKVMAREPVIICDECGRLWNERSWRFCPMCGAVLVVEVPVNRLIEGRWVTVEVDRVKVRGR